MRSGHRAPSAKGGGAYGILEMTADVSQYTKAGLFAKGAKTDLLIRFSTVAGQLAYSSDAPARQAGIPGHLVEARLAALAACLARAAPAVLVAARGGTLDL